MTDTTSDNTADSARAARETARRLRVQNIVNGALVRQRLGIRAGYRLLDDGRHEVRLGSKTWTAARLDEAIAQSQGGPRR
jgi:TolB-like protein